MSGQRRTRNAPPPAPAAQPTATTGASAVQQSKQSRQRQETLTNESDDAISFSSVRRVAGKTFYLREGVWTDAEFKLETKLPEIALRFGTDEYFALLKREPRLAEFFALGERVVVVFNGRVYRVSSVAN